jgi:hypothetical protein
MPKMYLPPRQGAATESSPGVRCGQDKAISQNIILNSLFLLPLGRNKIPRYGSSLR